MLKQRKSKHYKLIDLNYREQLHLAVKDAKSFPPPSQVDEGNNWGS